MTLTELRAALAAELESAEADVEANQAALRKAELRAAFLRGKLAALAGFVDPPQKNDIPTITTGTEATTE